MENINQLHESFWKFAGSLKGEHTMESAFEKWAGTQEITIEDAQTVWKFALTEVENYYIKQAAITLSGDAEEIRSLMEGKNTGTAPLNVPKVEAPKPPMGPNPLGAPPMGGPAGPKPAIPAPPAGAPAPGAAGPTPESLLDELDNE